MNKSSEKSQKVSVKNSTKGRGKDVEIRSKKHKNELHILKMSQEWDLRRQQRRLDRQKWVEERRNQKLPIWQRVGNLRVQANEEEILHGRPDNEHVNKKEHIKNSNEGSQAWITKDDEIKVKVKQTVKVPPAESDPFRVKCARLSELIQERYGPNQTRNSAEEIHFIKTDQRTVKQPLQYSINTLDTSNVSAAQITGQVAITTFKSSSKVRKFLNFLQVSEAYLHMRAACRRKDQYNVVNICIPVPCCQKMITRLKIMHKKVFNLNLMKTFDLS